MRNNKLVYDRLEKLEVPCPICGGTSFETLATIDRYRMGIRTVGCHGCGLAMTNPQPTVQAMEDFYGNHYRRFYENVTTPSLKYIQQLGRDKRARYTAEYLKRAGLLDGEKSVVDVGCAEGSLLKEITRQAPRLRVEGIEPNKAFAGFAQDWVGCKVYADLDEALECITGSCDIVITNHVAEHVLNPVTFLEDLQKLLNKNGVIYIDVPSLSEYKSIESLHIAHLYHFSQKTLAAAGRAANLVGSEPEKHSPPKHPRSIRCIFTMQERAAPVICEKNEEDERCWDKLRRAQSTAWRYFVRRSKSARLILEPFRRVMSVLSGRR